MRSRPPLSRHTCTLASATHSEFIFSALNIYSFLPQASRLAFFSAWGGGGFQSTDDPFVSQVLILPDLVVRTSKVHCGGKGNHLLIDLGFSVCYLTLPPNLEAL